MTHSAENDVPEPCPAPPGSLCLDTGCWDMDRCVIPPGQTAENDAQRERDAATLRTVADELVRRDLTILAGMLLPVADRLTRVIPPEVGRT